MTIRGSPVYSIGLKVFNCQTGLLSFLRRFCPLVQFSRLSGSISKIRNMRRCRATFRRQASFDSSPAGCVMNHHIKQHSTLTNPLSWYQVAMGSPWAVEPSRLMCPRIACVSAWGDRVFVLGKLQGPIGAALQRCLCLGCFLCYILSFFEMQLFLGFFW
jgi:hypothetical protein